MADFVYDVITLNGAKVDRAPIPVGEDPNKWLDVSDWNPAISALNDIRDAIINNRFLGLQRLAVQPNVPTGGAPDFMWMTSGGVPTFHIGGTNYNFMLTPALTAGVLPVATGADTIGNSSFLATGPLLDLVATAGGVMTIGDANTTGMIIGAPGAIVSLLGDALSQTTVPIGSVVTQGTFALLSPNATALTTSYPSARLVYEATYWNGTASGTEEWDLWVGMDSVSPPRSALNLNVNGGANLLSIKYTGALELQDGSAALVSATGYGAIRYNNTTHEFEQSVNGGAWAPLAAPGTVTGTFTATHVPVATGAGTLGDTPMIYASNLLALPVNAIGTANTIGASLQNTTAATGAVTLQYSPALEWSGHVWTGTADQQTKWNAQLVFSGNTTSQLVFTRQYGAGAASSILTLADLGGGLGAVYYGPVSSNDYIYGGNNTLNMRAAGTTMLSMNTTNVTIAKGLIINTVTAGQDSLNVAGSTAGTLEIIDSGGAPSVFKATSLNGGIPFSFQFANSGGFKFFGDATAGTGKPIVDIQGFTGSTTYVERVLVGPTPGAGALGLMVEWDGVVTAQDAGVSLQNTTASTVGVPQQFSPMHEFVGHSWNTTVTAVDKTQKMAWQLRPVTGTLTSPELVLWASQDGGAYTEAAKFASINGDPSLSIHSGGAVIGYTAGSAYGYISTSSTQLRLIASGTVYTQSQLLPLSDNAYQLGGGVGNRWSNIWGTIFSNQNNGIGTAQTVGTTLTNNTAATAGVPVQNSPMLEFNSQAWNTTVTASTKINKAAFQLLPTSGTATVSQLGFFVASDGAAYSSTPSLTFGNGTITTAGTMGIGLTATAINLGGSTVDVTQSTQHQFKVAQTTSAVSGGFLYQSAAQTIATLVEVNSANFNTSATRTWGAAGTLTFQRENLFQAPTYTDSAGATTISNAVTVSITGPPIAGPNVTITNPYALVLETGNLGMGPGTLITSNQQGPTNTTAMTLAPNVADGASSIALKINSITSLSTTGHRLVSIQNAGTEVFGFDANAVLYAPQGVFYNQNVGSADFNIYGLYATAGSTLQPSNQLNLVGTYWTTFANGWATNLKTVMTSASGGGAGYLSIGFQGTERFQLLSTGELAAISNAIGTGAATIGISAQNSTLATAGAVQQNSPWIEMTGAAWNTTSLASNPIKFGFQTIPASGSNTTIGGQMNFGYSISGITPITVASLDNNGNFNTSGGVQTQAYFAGGQRNAASTVTVTASDFIVGVSGSGARTVNLPAVSACKRGQIFIIQDIGNSAGVITINRAGTDLINGGTSVTIAAAYGALMIWNDGSAAWYAH